MSGRATAPMSDRRGSVGGRDTTPMYAKWDSVSRQDTTPMHDRWDSLTSQYGWWQLTYEILYDYARATSRGVCGGVGYGHGSSTNH